MRSSRIPKLFAHVRYKECMSKVLRNGVPIGLVPSFFYPPRRCGFSDDLIPILVTTLMLFGSDSKAVALFEPVSEPSSISVALTGNMVILSLLSVTVV